jgi:predicted nucleic acid-binding protein
MRVVVDTNIVFSAVLNTNSKIAKIILKPHSGLNFYATETLRDELFEHKNKLKKIAGYSETDFLKLSSLIISRVKFINVGFIPAKVLTKAASMMMSIDIDDTEFIALTEHVKGLLWTGDKNLVKGLSRVGWDKIISTNSLYLQIFRR